MQKENKIQEIESFINILLVRLGEKNYREYINNKSLLKKYDTLMSNFEEENISNNLLDQVYRIIKQKIETL